MKEKIGVIALVLLGMFAIFMFFIGIPVLHNMNKPLADPGDPFLHQTAAEGYISPECRKKVDTMNQLLEPLKTAQNAVRDRQNEIAYEGVTSMPIGNYTSRPYILPQYQAEYDQLHVNYMNLSDQIEALQIKYACT